MLFRFFETTAYEIFDDMYKINKKKLEYHILAYDYESNFRNTAHCDEWKDNSRELLCVAYRGKCMVRNVLIVNIFIKEISIAQSLPKLHRNPMEKKEGKPYSAGNSLFF